ncbi:MAG TPA: O-methyltransferase [Phycisphaerales bacterium]|nr:O-methyltransferase [Phycisphaerales bacterium]
MSQELWNAVDDYFNAMLVRPDSVLDEALAASAAAGLPPIAVSASQGKLLHVMARMVGAGRILELGTLAGYSTIWLGRALRAEGRLVTIEADPNHAAVARANIARAGLVSRVDLRVGRALEVLPTLAGEEPFDLVFIDADKANIPAYFAWSLDHTRRGGVIIVDNVVRDGEVIQAESEDPSVRGVRTFMEMVRNERRVTATAVQTVGSKGYDGFAIAMVV